MKILLAVHSQLDRNSGAAGAVLQLGDALKSIGQDVNVIGLPGQDSVWAKISGITWPIQCARTFRTAEDHVDVIESSTGDNWIYARCRRHSLAKPNRSPLLVTHSHGLEHMMHDALKSEVQAGRSQVGWKYPLYHGGLRLWEVRQSLLLSDICIFLNETEKDYAVYNLKIPAYQCHVLPNGCDSRILQANPTFSTPKKGLNIVQIGSFIARKGVDYSVDALNTFLSKNQDSKMWFLGTGCDESHVINKFNPSIRHQITVTPAFSRELLPTLLTDQHVLLFPSLSEGFGLVVVEAMACGLAPIVSDIAGPNTIVTHNKNGILIPAAQSHSIVNALDRLNGDRFLLENLRYSARERSEDFDWRSLARLRKGLYEDAIRSRTC